MKLDVRKIIYSPFTVHVTPGRVTLFCFIIVQKWYLLGKCSQSVTHFQRFFIEKM